LFIVATYTKTKEVVEKFHAAYIKDYATNSSANEGNADNILAAQAEPIEMVSVKSIDILCRAVHWLKSSNGEFVFNSRKFTYFHNVILKYNYSLTRTTCKSCYC